MTLLALPLNALQCKGWELETWEARVVESLFWFGYPHSLDGGSNTSLDFAAARTTSS